jgi:Uma2 family endonuclease
MAVHTDLALSTFEKSLMIPSAPIWRLSVDQYHSMIDAGVLTDDDPVELLEGWLVTKMPKNLPHTLATQLARDVLAGVLPSGWFINTQEPITTADSEPEPDVMIVRGERRDYVERHPQPEEVALVIEVAHTTLQRDRTLKLRIYANARIRLYWILNLEERQLEVYSEPFGAGDQASYRQRNDYQEADEVPIMIGDQEVGRLTVRDLLS